LLEKSHQEVYDGLGIKPGWVTEYMDRELRAEQIQQLTVVTLKRKWDDIIERYTTKVGSVGGRIIDLVHTNFTNGCYVKIL